MAMLVRACQCMGAFLRQQAGVASDTQSAAGKRADERRCHVVDSSARRLGGLAQAVIVCPRGWRDVK